MKYIFSLNIILSFSTLVFGQEYKSLIGIEGGPNTSIVTNIDYDYGNRTSEINPTIAYSTGLFFQYNFSKHISFRTNFAFERKGYFYHYQECGSSACRTGIARPYFDYIIIPLLVRINFGQKINFFVNGGPYLGFLSKAKNFDRKTYDTGISLGLGIAIPINKRLLISLEARNNRGLLNVKNGYWYSMVNLVEYPDSKVFIRSTNILIGFAYKFGKKQSETKEENK